MRGEGARLGPAPWDRPICLLIHRDPLPGAEALVRLRECRPRTFRILAGLLAACALYASPAWLTRYGFSLRSDPPPS